MQSHAEHTAFQSLSLTRLEVNSWTNSQLELCSSFLIDLKNEKRVMVFTMEGNYRSSH